MALINTFYNLLIILYGFINIIDVVYRLKLVYNSTAKVFFQKLLLAAMKSKLGSY